jgi:hypothetical protein
MCACPHVLLHLSFGHQAAGMRRQIVQQRQGPRPQGNEVTAAPQVALWHLQPEGPKGDLVLLAHRTSRRYRLNSL